jgi:hypothetical protein
MAKDSNTMQIAELVKRLLVVPDKLVTAQLCLRPLGRGDPTAPAETMLTINDACDLMHSALADVVEVARNLADLSGVESGVSAFQRVGIDSYSRPLP